MPCDVVYLIDELQTKKENPECPEVRKNQYREGPSHVPKNKWLCAKRANAPTRRGGREAKKQRT